jgi:protein-S-isoprenylcysteine O-methyltransferase Ste14
MITLVSSITAAACVAIYWITVFVKSVLIARVIRKDPNVIPREKTGRLMRVLWFPVLMAWIFYPLFHLTKPAFAGPAWTALAAVGAVATVFALAASFYCWREMGTSWRIGIDPREKTTMIVSGPYRYLRHPIYALSILLMLGSLAANPSIVLLIVAVLHCGLLVTESLREERHMLKTHGQAYADYMRGTGRYLPRF